MYIRKLHSNTGVHNMENEKKYRKLSLHLNEIDYDKLKALWLEETKDLEYKPSFSGWLKKRIGL